MHKIALSDLRSQLYNLFIMLHYRCGLYALLFPTTLATCPAHLFVVNFITLMKAKLNANPHTYIGKENSVRAWTKNKSGHYVSSKKSCNSPHTLGPL
jgi:hypothetical protein